MVRRGPRRIYKRSGDRGGLLPFLALAAAVIALALGMSAIAVIAYGN